MIDTDKMLAEVRREIARLQAIERALTANVSQAKAGRGRISERGRTVISLAAQLRHARRSKDRARIKDLTEKLKVAKRMANTAKGHFVS
jgi:hypothetical protein